MVASQGVETSSSNSAAAQHHHQHHHNPSDVHFCPPYGEYYPEQYHYIPGTHPGELCPHHVHLHQGEYGKR